jgi:hypothetical protein
MTHSFLKRLSVSSIIMCVLVLPAMAQEPFKVSSGDNVLEIGGIVSSYMNIRSYTPGTTPKYKNNTFCLKDARLDLSGKFGKDFDYHLQMDFAGMPAVYDPASPFLNDAYVTYKGVKKFANIRFGYGKVPYSLNSVVDHEWTPYWERPLVSKGDFFARRDIGIRLDRSFWNDRVKAFAGIYTGVGELSLGGLNDPSGAFEYVGRVEVGYPERLKEFDAIIDTKNSKHLSVLVGLNTRYSKRVLPNDPKQTYFIPGETGALTDDSVYNCKVVDGEKIIYGGDISVLYHGFSLQAEAHILNATPSNHSNGILNNTYALYNNTNFKAGGWFVTANYFSKKYKSLLSVRYEELNANDLVPGMTKRIAYSYCYQIKGFHSMIRAEMYHIIDQTEAIMISSWNNQFRVGWQFAIE